MFPGYFLNISWFRDISEYFEKYVLVHGYPEYAEEYLLYPRENAQSDKMIELEWHKIIIKKIRRADFIDFLGHHHLGKLV